MTKSNENSFLDLASGALQEQKNFLFSSIFWAINTVFIILSIFSYLINMFEIISMFIIPEYLMLTYGFVFYFILEAFDKSFFGKILGALILTLYLISIMGVGFGITSFFI